MSRVLVTGASGMLGHRVALDLAARGDTVTVLQRQPAGTGLREVLGDVADAPTVSRAVRGQDAVVHLAARVGVVGRWTDFARTNVVGTRTVVEALHREGVPRLVHVSSPSVAHTGRSLTGAAAGPADPAHARGHYARSKAAAELVALGADGPGADGSDLAVSVLRPHLVWGPGDTQLVGRILRRARQGRLVLVGSGAALVDTTYVSNAADAVIAALDPVEPARGQALVVTNGEPRPIGELLAAFCRAGGAPAPRLRVPTPLAWGVGAVVEAGMALSLRTPGLPDPVEPPLTRFLVGQMSTAHWFDQRRTRAVLGWAPRVSLDEGLVALAASLRRAGARRA